MKPARVRNRRASRRPSNKLKIAIIGAGRLGTALGLALNASGHLINIAIARSARSAGRAARVFETRGVAIGARGLFQLSKTDRQVLQQCAVLIISTPDDAIPQVAPQIAEVLGEMSRHGKPQRSRMRPVAFHTSGALTSGVLDPLRELGMAAGSIHPLISISGEFHRAPSFANIHFAVEGDRPAVRLGKQLVRDLGGDSFVIDTEKKALYHAAALMASPNLTALIDIAIEMLEHGGLSATRGRQILLPLINSTIENLVHQDPRQSLTGTLKRGDIATVKMHLAAIASERLTDAMRAYVTLGRRSLKLSDISRTRRLAIDSLLDGATSRDRR